MHAVDESADRRIGRRRVETRVGDAADVQLCVERRQRGEENAGTFAARSFTVKILFSTSCSPP